MCVCVCVWRLSLFASACNDNDDDDALPIVCALGFSLLSTSSTASSNWIFSQEARKMWLLNRLISLSFIVKYKFRFLFPFDDYSLFRRYENSNIYAPCFWCLFLILAWRELFFSSWNHITRIISYSVEFNLAKLNPIDDVSMYIRRTRECMKL